MIFKHLLVQEFGAKILLLAIMIANSQKRWIKMCVQQCTLSC